MPTNYPTSLDTFPKNAQGEGLIINLEDALEAVEAKLGVDGSTDANSVDNKLATHLHTGTYVQAFDALKYLASGTPGVDAASDTAAIQAAWDAAAAVGGECLISRGSWLLKRQTGTDYCVRRANPGSATIRIAAGAEVKLANGESVGSTACHMFVLGDGPTAYVGAKVIIEGTLNGNKVNNIVPGGRDISADSGLKIQGPFTDVLVAWNGGRIINTNGDAFIATGQRNLDGSRPATPTRASALTLRTPRIDACGEGILWVDVDWVFCISPHVTNVTLQDSIEPVNSDHFYILHPNIDNGGQGIDIYSGCAHWDVLGGDIRNCYDGIGAGVGGSQPVTDGRIIGVDISGCTNGIHINSGAAATAAELHRILVQANTVSGSSQEDILVSSASGRPMSRVRVYDNITDKTPSIVGANAITATKVRSSAGTGLLPVVGGPATDAASARTVANELRDALIISGMVSPLTDLPNLTALFEADQITGHADGSTLQTWPDRSPAANNLTQATSGLRPTYETNELNGLPVLRFNAAVGSFLASVANTAVAQPFTSFLVAKATSTANQWFYSSATDYSGFNIDAAEWRAYSGVGLTAGAADTDWHIFCIIHNGASSKVRIGGGAGTAGNAGAVGREGLIVGATTLGGVSMTGDISAYIESSSVLSLANINAVGKYLAAKTGLAWATAT